MTYSTIPSSIEGRPQMRSLSWLGAGSTAIMISLMCKKSAKTLTMSQYLRSVGGVSARAKGKTEL